MDRKLIETLGKVILVTAWADKKVSPDEMDSLKDLLFQFQQTINFNYNAADELWAETSGFYLASTSDDMGFTERQQAMFDMYAKSPIDAGEQDHLVNELKEAIWSEEDK